MTSIHFTFTFSFHTGQFCSRKAITYFKDFKTFSLQPKLILLALSLLFFLGIIYFYITAKRKTKSHKIPRFRQTLITLKEHSILLSVSLAVLLTDQSVSAFIELFYSELGPSEAFWIWWIQTFLLYFVAHIVLPAFCLRCGRLFTFFASLICQEWDDGVVGVPGSFGSDISWPAPSQVGRRLGFD